MLDKSTERIHVHAFTPAACRLASSRPCISVALCGQESTLCHVCTCCEVHLIHAHRTKPLRPRVINFLGVSQPVRTKHRWRVSLRCLPRSHQAEPQPGPHRIWCTKAVPMRALHCRSPGSTAPCGSRIAASHTCINLDQLLKGAQLCHPSWRLRDKASTHGSVRSHGQSSCKPPSLIPGWAQPFLPSRATRVLSVSDT